MASESMLKTFLTLVRVGKFTDTARELYLSQQAVSKQMAKLEQELNCTLFNRQRGHISLTPAGEIYYKAFTQINDIMTAARSEASALDPLPDPTLNIGIPELLDLRTQISALSRAFHTVFPDVRLSFKSLPDWTILDWLDEGKLDACFTFIPEIENRTDLEYLPIEEVQEMLVVSAEHPKATAEATYLDFTDLPVLYTHRPDLEDNWIIDKLQNIGFPSDRVVATDNFLSSCIAVEQMEGVVFLLGNCRYLNGDAFRSYPTNVSTSICLVCRSGTRMQMTRQFMSLAKKVFSRQ